MPLQTNALDWQRAAHEYLRLWVDEAGFENQLRTAFQAVDQTSFDKFRNLVAASSYFQTIGTLPKEHEIRCELALAIFEAPQPVSANDRCVLIEEIAGAYQNNGKSPRSAVSKASMLRYPENSFIHDSFARKALGCGNNHQMFVARWIEHCEMIVTTLAGSENFNFDAAGAARVVDKLLWVLGRNDRDAPLTQPEALSAEAILLGAQIQSQLTQLPEPLVNLRGAGQPSWLPAPRRAI